MTKESLTRLHRIYSILLGIVIVIAGFCLIFACIGIYRSGNHPFSRQAVADAFSNIAFPVYLCLVMTIIGFILDVVLPAGPHTEKHAKPYAQILNRLYTAKDLSQCDEALRIQIEGLQKKRRLHSVIRTVLMSLSSIVFLIYALNGENFYDSAINDAMIRAMYVLLPCLAVSFGYALFTAYYNENSIKAELALLKQVPGVSGNSSISDCSNIPNPQPDSRLHIIRSAVLILAVSILVYGLITGGAADVLTKAANICTECIGLG